jgi:hypothetical protein
MVIGPIRPHFVESYDQQQPPQVFTVGNVVIAFLDGLEEGTKHGLDDVIGIHSPRQMRRKLPTGQSMNARRISAVQLGGGLLLAQSESTEQGFVR